MLGRKCDSTDGPSACDGGDVILLFPSGKEDENDTITLSG
jgi:hypothetical protein